MKKKFLTFLIILASVIACIVCFAACNKDNSENPTAADCVGNYEFVSVRTIIKATGEQDVVQEIKAGENGIAKNYYVLEVKDDNTWIMTTNRGTESYDTYGTWTVSGGKTVITTEEGMVFNGKISGGILSFSNKSERTEGEVTYSSETTMTFKKVIEETPAE